MQTGSQEWVKSHSVADRITRAGKKSFRCRQDHYVEWVKTLSCCRLDQKSGSNRSSISDWTSKVGQNRNDLHQGAQLALINESIYTLRSGQGSVKSVYGLVVKFSGNSPSSVRSCCGRAPSAYYHQQHHPGTHHGTSHPGTEYSV